MIKSEGEIDEKVLYYRNLGLGIGQVQSRTVWDPVASWTFLCQIFLKKVSSLQALRFYHVDRDKWVTLVPYLSLFSLIAGLP